MRLRYPEDQPRRDGAADEPLGVTPDSINRDQVLKEGPSGLPSEGSWCVGPTHCLLLVHTPNQPLFFSSPH